MFRSSTLRLLALGVGVFCSCLAVGLGAVALVLPLSRTATVALGNTAQPARTALATTTRAPIAAPVAQATLPSLAPEPATPTPEPPGTTPEEPPEPSPPGDAPIAAPPPAAPPSGPTQIGPVPCHPSYPDFCIPPPPPDFNCTSVLLRALPSFRPGFRVRHDVANPDQHDLVPDRDGRACEG